jgi:predicted RNA binding protein YcfA (HicA-like mRNA interferase family)
MPILKPREVIVILNALGFIEVRQLASHPSSDPAAERP